MKKLVLILLLTSILVPRGIAGKFFSDGDSFTKFGKYKIESSESPTISKEEVQKTYLITYENSGLTLLVTVVKSGDEIKYITTSDALSVQYVSHGICFGVEKIDEKYLASALKTSDTAFNRYEYFHQKVITSWELTEFEKIKLIAAYYPALLNNIDNLIIAKQG
jgi:hypothetical protein